MRRLAQPEVLRSAAVAALMTTLVCSPRVLLWTTRRYPFWYLETVLLFGSIVLWAFVFAWHTAYFHRPVFTLKIAPELFALTTLAGIVGALALSQFLDPLLRLRTPLDYPANVQQWLSLTLFSLALNQLFLTFAPLAWLMRIVQNARAAIALTVAFGVVVLLLKVSRSPIPPSPGLFAGLLLVRIIIGLLSVLFYLRGGILLAWWWGFLLDARHLLALERGSASAW